MNETLGGRIENQDMSKDMLGLSKIRNHQLLDEVRAQCCPTELGGCRGPESFADGRLIEFGGRSSIIPAVYLHRIEGIR
jgi:hypothetical protein